MIRRCWIALTVLLLAACATPAAQPTVEPLPVVEYSSEEERQHAAADAAANTNAFTFDFYQAASPPDDNFVASPYSIVTAYSMLYGGARTTTEAQMAEVLHLLPQAEQHTALNALTHQITPDENDNRLPQVNVANSLWVQQGFALRDAYLGLLEGTYGASPRPLDFARRNAAAREINEWTAEQTEDRIEEIIMPGQLDSSTRVVLVNAIYLQASWWVPFNEDNTSDEPFTLLDGSQVEVPTMHLGWGDYGGEGFFYTERRRYQALQIPYYGSLEMVIILPDDGHFERVRESLSGDLLTEIDADAEERRVNVALPKVDTEATVNLAELLPAMGLTLPFDAEAADLSGVAEAALSVSASTHKANITINEEGTEAAAATSIAILVSGPSTPPEEVDFTVDRPFIFLIRELESGAVLFVGHVARP